MCFFSSNSLDQLPEKPRTFSEWANDTVAEWFDRKVTSIPSKQPFLYEIPKTTTFFGKRGKIALATAITLIVALVATYFTLHHFNPTALEHIVTWLASSTPCWSISIAIGGGVLSGTAVMLIIKEKTQVAIYQDDHFSNDSEVDDDGYWSEYGYE